MGHCGKCKAKKKKVVRGKPPLVKPVGAMAVNAPYGGYKKLPK